MRTIRIIFSPLFFLLMVFVPEPALSQIVADHRIVSDFDKIPRQYLNEVKKMWVILAGESHSKGYRIGCQLLEASDPDFQVNIKDSGTPEGYSDQYLRLSRATWGDLSNPSGWIYGYGEEDWFTNETAINRTKAHLTYCNTNNLQISAMGFGWCWDMTANNWPGGTVDPQYQVRWAGLTNGGPDGSLRWGLNSEDQALTGNTVSMDTYLDATVDYINHCQSNGYPTNMFFTTGPVDGNGNLSENGYQRSIKHQRIRDFVATSTGRYLFDYADILCWSDAGEQKTISWTDFSGNVQSYQVIHEDNLLDLNGGYAEDGDHIGQRGALRLAKAMWWMLARMAGWDGSTLGVDQHGSNPGFSIMPNPAGDFLCIELDDISPSARYAITDINGRELLSSAMPEAKVNVDLSDLPAGIYVVKLMLNDRVELKKIIKQ